MESTTQSAGVGHAPGPPGFVSETYRCYKSHTEAFLTWLASQVGSKQFASTNDYVLAAERLKTAQPLLRVPQDILNHLQDAISLRRDCTAYYKARSLPDLTSTRGSSSGDIGSQGHRHFTGVLEKLKRILSPASIEDQTTPSKPQATKREYISHGQQQHQEQDPSTFNYYVFLSIKNTAQDEYILPQKHILPTVEPRTQSKQDKKMSLREDDALLAMYCLVDDLKHVRTSIVSMWEEYRDRKTSLVNAAVTSNTLLCYAEHLEMSFYNDYRDIIPETQLLEHVLLRSPEQKKANENVSWLSEDELPRVILDHLNDWRLSDENGILLKDFSRKDNPLTTGLNPGQLRRARQITFLREVLLEYRMMFAVYWFPYAVDQVARTFLQLIKGENVSLWMIFSVQMLIEIKQLLGPDVSRGLSEMQSSARNIVATLDEYERFERPLELASCVPQEKKSAEITLTNFNNLLDPVHQYVLDDAISRIKQSCFPPSLSALIGRQQKYFLLANHPILCGQYEFRMKAQFQNVTMITLKWQRVLLAAGHLYIACRIDGGLQTSWGRMEDLLRLWGSETFFLVERPLNFGDAYRHFALRLGAPIKAFAPTGHGKRPPTTDCNPPGGLYKFGYKLSFDPLIEFFFREQNVDERPPVEHFRLLLVKEANEPEGISGSQHNLSGPQIFKKHLNGLFVANEEKLNFNLIYMYRLCTRLLCNVAARSGDAFKWRREYEGEFDLRGQASQFPMWVLEDLNNLARPDKRLHASTQLEDARKYISVFIGVVERLEASGYLPNSTHSPVIEENRHLRAYDEEGINPVTKQDDPIVHGDTNTAIAVGRMENEQPASRNTAAAAESAVIHTDGPEVEASMYDGKNESQDPLITPHKVVSDEPGWKRYYFPSINSSPTAAKRAEIKAEVQAFFIYTDDDAWVEETVDQIWAYRGAEETGKST